MMLEEKLSCFWILMFAKWSSAEIARRDFMETKHVYICKIMI